MRAGSDTVTLVLPVIDVCDLNKLELMMTQSKFTALLEMNDD
jgi:hypothetical protein